jgi:hypothetical protein
MSASQPLCSTMGSPPRTPPVRAEGASREGNLGLVIEGANARAGRELKPVERRASWFAWGLALQVIGVGIPVTVALRRANKDGLVGSVTHYTVRLVWHEMLRSGADVALIIVGVVVFVAGAVVLARPFVTHRSTLFVAVPVAATAGIAVLGVIALLCAAVIAVVESPDGMGDALNNVSWPGGGRRKRRK